MKQVTTPTVAELPMYTDLMGTGVTHRWKGQHMKPISDSTNQPTWRGMLRNSILSLLCSGVLAACTRGPSPGQPSERQITARAMWLERCKKSGEFIHKTVDGVEGIVLLKLRPDDFDFADQFKMNDPYGRDLGGKGYIESFLRGSFQGGRTDHVVQLGEPPHMGYLFVDATDPSDGKRYRYTGRIEEPWQTDRSYLKGYLRFVMDKQPAPASFPRYGVTFEDISTSHEREYWIAGSSLKVIDLQTGEVIAERVGYMYDWAQGSAVGQRSPWLFAADNACPAFRGSTNSKVRVPAASTQPYQTLDFVEKVLRPAK